MDTARWIVALVALVGYPPAFVFWFVVHPFVRYWRKVGLLGTYSVTLAILVAVATVLYASRDVLLRVEFGTSFPLAVVAVVLLVIGLTIEGYCRRSLRLTTLAGVPELAPDTHPGRLLQEGAYARMRHPRYTGASFGVVAVALFANYLATYVLALAYFPIIYLISVLEERELVDRFGEAYRRYQQRVPRFMPRPRRARS